MAVAVWLLWSIVVGLLWLVGRSVHLLVEAWWSVLLLVRVVSILIVGRELLSAIAVASSNWLLHVLLVVRWLVCRRSLLLRSSALSTLLSLVELLATCLTTSGAGALLWLLTIQWLLLRLLADGLLHVATS